MKRFRIILEDEDVELLKNEDWTEEEANNLLSKIGRQVREEDISD